MMATKTTKNILEDTLANDAKHVKMYNVSNGKTERVMPKASNDGELVLNRQEGTSNRQTHPEIIEAEWDNGFAYASVKLATEHQPLVEMLHQAVEKKVQANSKQNKDTIAGLSNERLELEAQNIRLEQQIAELREQVRQNNARLSEVKKDLAAFDATRDAIENQVLRQLVQLGIVTSEQLPVKATKQRTYSRGTGIKKTSFSIEFDGVVDGEQSYFDTPGNLAWYKFNKCGSTKLFEVLAEQNNGIRAGSPEHEALPNKRLAAQLDGHTFAFIMK